MTEHTDHTAPSAADTSDPAQWLYAQGAPRYQALAFAAYVTQHVLGGTPLPAAKRQFDHDPRAIALVTEFGRMPEPAAQPVAEPAAVPPARLLEIEHSHAEGTTLSGTRREDDLYTTLRGLGWLYRRSVGDFRLQGSQDKPAKQGPITRTADALRARGFEVTVCIDRTPRPVEQAERERAARAEDRAERLGNRAEARTAEATRREAAGNSVLDHIPLGQPLLVGHHSYRADRRRRERAVGNLWRAHELRGEAARLREAADSAAAHMTHRHTPSTVVNRIAELEAEQRRLQRRPAGSGEEAQANQRERVEYVEEQLRYWRGVRAEQITAGVATDYSRASVAVGDLVRYRNRWLPVARVNAKSVSVPHTLLGGTQTDTIRYELLDDVVESDDSRWDQLAGLAWVRARAMLGNNQRMHAAWAPLEPQDPA